MGVYDHSCNSQCSPEVSKNKSFKTRLMKAMKLFHKVTHAIIVSNIKGSSYVCGHVTILMHFKMEHVATSLATL
jgi:hypothetical protein